MMGIFWKKFAQAVNKFFFVFLISAFLFLSCNSSAARVDSPQNSQKFWPKRLSGRCAGNEAERFDCFPQGNATAAQCVQMGCCWNAGHHSIGTPPVHVPRCFFPMDYAITHGYNMTSVNDTKTGFTGTLSKMGASYHPNTITQLKVMVTSETKTRLHIKIVDASKERYEVPLIDRPTDTTDLESADYIVEKKADPFQIRVMRKSDRTILFDSSVGMLIFADQFLQISSTLPSPYMYGLGEHEGPLLNSVNWARYSMFTRDCPGSFRKNNANMYGVHPFYLSMENSSNSHGVFLLNSNAMEVIAQPLPALTWRTIGGVLDFYIFLGPTPTSVVQQYSQVIGLPFMPPYWSQGFHLCRWGYKTLNGTKLVWKRNVDAGVPFDVQWNDMDYAVAYRDFTYDNTTFKGLPEFIQQLHDMGMHYMQIFDAGISAEPDAIGHYNAYDYGAKLDLFVKNATGQFLEGRVWPKKVVWPDYLNNATYYYWTELLYAYHQTVQVDGSWIDMNEPSNLGPAGSLLGCTNNTLDNPPYTPAVAGDTLISSTLCMSAKHGKYNHYDVHSLFGTAMTRVASHGLALVRKKRPFVISRSTFPGQSKYGGHWTGDDASTYPSMAVSVPGVLSFSLFGIPMVGADICGFGGSATEDLCQRWFQLGAFYPFCRNHNNKGGRDQDPAAFSKQATAVIRDVLLIRYSLLPFLYTLFFYSHTTGSTVARPLFFEFKEDPTTYKIDSQFMWGMALLISPVLTPNTTSLKAYLPPSSEWFNFYNGERMTEKGFVVLPAPMDTINLHVRHGSIIPMQQPNTTTTATRKNDFKLLVAPDLKGAAAGNLYWDDGDSLDSVSSKLYNTFNFTAVVSADSGEVRSEVLYANYNTTMTLGELTVFAVKSRPSSVAINGKPHANFTYNDQTQVLYVYALGADMLHAGCVQTSITWK